MMDSSPSQGSSDHEERRQNNRKKGEQPNKDVSKGGLDGLQEGALIHINSSLDVPRFNAYVEAFPAVAYFTGTWCGPAHEMNDLVIELSEYYMTLTFIKIDLPQENQKDIFEFMMQMNIRELPTFLFYYEGKRVFKLVGAFVDELVHLTHSLYTRQVLNHIKSLNREIREATLNGVDISLIQKLKDELSKVTNGVGEEVEMYNSLGLLQ